MGFGEHIYKLKNVDKTTIYSVIETREMPGLTSKSPEEREFVVDSGASMHMLSKKDLSSGEVELSENPGLRNLPEKKEEFTESLEDTDVLAPAHISHDSDSERPAKVAHRKHSDFSHFPKDRNCEVCLRTGRRRIGEAVPRAEKFDDLITADHKVFNEDGESRNNHPYAVVVQDLPYSMDSILSAQNKDFTGDGKEFTIVPRAVAKSKSYLHKQFIGIWQIL